MNKLKFVEFIRQPSQLTPKELEELKQVVSEYPYFQNARIILAKGSKLKEAPDTKSRIASASVYSTNRALLKKYMNDELIFLRSLSVEESVSSTKKKGTPPAPPKPDVAVRSDDFETKTQKPTSPVEFDIPDEQGETTEKFESKKEIIPDTSAPLIPEPTDEEPSSLDNLIDALWKDVEEMRKSKARFLEIEKKIEEDDAVNEAVKKATKKSEESTSKKTKSKAATSKAETAKVKKSTTAKSSTSAKSATKKSTAKKSTKTSSKKDDKGGETKSEQKDDKSDPKDEQHSLIDNFIRINPTMPPMAKDKEAKPGDLSGDSTEFPHDIASEYLAEIFLEQGRTERAIQIYELLIEKYPEKSVYFADIIKKLNEQN